MSALANREGNNHTILSHQSRPQGNIPAVLTFFVIGRRKNFPQKLLLLREDRTLPLGAPVR